MIKIYYYLLAHNMLCSGAPSQIHLWSGSSVLVLFNCRPCTKKSDFREKPVLSLSLSMGRGCRRLARRERYQERRGSLHHPSS